MKTNKLILTAFVALISTATFAFNTTLSLSKNHYKRGEDVVVSHSKGLGSETDYIGIAPLGRMITGIPGGYTSTWSYLNPKGSVSGTTTIPAGNFMNLEETPDGYYYAVYLLNDGYDYGSEMVYFYLGDDLPETVELALTVDEITEEYTIITFAEDITWRTLIYEISINGVPTEDYAFIEGTLYILNDLRSGTYEIILKATNWVDTKVIVGASAVNNAKIDHLLKFANPSDGIIEVDNHAGLIQSLVVFDVQGKQLLQRNLSNSNTRVDVSDLSRGVYFVNFIGNQLNKTIKIIRQ